MSANSHLLEPPQGLLRLLLLVSVAFFVCMGTVHFFGIKLPILFVYWDTPFYAYQDKIIAFTLVTYAALFFGASRHRLMVPYALISIWGTAVGLSLVNLSGALQSVLGDGGTALYWLITAAFAGLATVLTLLWRASTQSAVAG
ncbi:MAG: hypothetical protein AAGH45_12620 [Pseudomonadota bacterium]